MKNKNIISISGRIYSGKDSLATAIQFLTRTNSSPEFKSLEEYKDTLHGETPAYEIKKYAGKLKQIAGLLFGKHPSFFERQENKTLLLPEEWQDQSGSLSYRWALQILGTEAIRNTIHKNAWVNALFADYNENSRWIITDTRFPNELDAVRERGGICIRIERGPEPREEDRAKLHTSETALDHINDWDYVVYNNGSMEDLLVEAKKILIKENIINENIENRS